LSPGARGASIARMTSLPDDVRGLFEGPNYAHLATVTGDGAPHSVPVWTNVEGEHVVFFTQPESRKARNIDRDPRVAMSISDHEHPYRMAQVRGRVVEIRDGDAALEIMDRMAVKYTGEPFPMRRGRAYLVAPERVQQMTLPFTHSPA
jgi:PPOX class probable F420-dependent enzyme